MSAPEIVATGLSHPQGPDFLDSGELVFAETYLGRLTMWTPSEGVRPFAQVGGAPNGTLVGADGLVYYTQNGWTVGPWIAPEPAPPGIGRVSVSGDRHEVLCTLPDGIGVGAAHDLTWGNDGHLYFSDSGKFGMGDPNPKHTGYLYRLRRSGELEQLLDCKFGYPAGLLMEHDGSLVWVEARSRRLRRLTAEGEASTILELPEGNFPEAIRVDVEGNYWIPIIQGFVKVVTPTGELVQEYDLRSIEAHPLNCIFGSDNALYVIDFGADLREHPNANGRILRLDVNTAGRPHLRGSIDSSETE